MTATLDTASREIGLEEQRPRCPHACAHQAAGAGGPPQKMEEQRPRCPFTPRAQGRRGRRPSLVAKASATTFLVCKRRAAPRSAIAATKFNQQFLSFAINTFCRMKKVCAAGGRFWMHRDQRLRYKIQSTVFVVCNQHFLSNDKGLRGRRTLLDAPRSAIAATKFNQQFLSFAINTFCRMKKVCAAGGRFWMRRAQRSRLQNSINSFCRLQSTHFVE